MSPRTCGECTSFLPYTTEEAKEMWGRARLLGEPPDDLGHCEVAPHLSMIRRRMFACEGILPAEAEG